jgi:hypothetical protein
MLTIADRQHPQTLVAMEAPHRQPPSHHLAARHAPGTATIATPAAPCASADPDEAGSVTPDGSGAGTLARPMPRPHTTSPRCWSLERRTCGGDGAEEKDDGSPPHSALGRGRAPGESPAARCDGGTVNISPPAKPWAEEAGKATGESAAASPEPRGQFRQARQAIAEERGFDAKIGCWVEVYDNQYSEWYRAKVIGTQEDPPSHSRAPPGKPAVWIHYDGWSAKHDRWVELDSGEIGAPEDYEVQEIIAHRQVGDDVEYLVRWKEYGSDEDTWEPKQELLKSAAKIVEAYEQSHAQGEAADDTAAGDSTAVAEDVLQGRHYGTSKRRTGEQPVHVVSINEQSTQQRARSSTPMISSDEVDVKPALLRIAPSHAIAHIDAGTSRHSAIELLTSSDSSSGEEEDEDNEVQEIIAHRQVEGDVEYLVRRKKYGSDADTWEPKQELLESAAAKIVEAYEQSRAQGEAAEATSTAVAAALVAGGDGGTVNISPPAKPWAEEAGKATGESAAASPEPRGQFRKARQAIAEERGFDAKIGCWVEVYDNQYSEWYRAKVIGTQEDPPSHSRAPPGKPAVWIHYDGWSAKHDRWVELDSGEIGAPEDYEVQEIIAHRQVGDDVEYLVRWKEYGSDEDTWKPKQELLKSAAKIVEAYEQSRAQGEAAEATSTVVAAAALVAGGDSGTVGVSPPVKRRRDSTPECENEEQNALSPLKHKGDLERAAFEAIDEEEGEEEEGQLKCLMCGAQHSGLYGSGRFCNVQCKNKFNGRAEQPSAREHVRSSSASAAAASVGEEEVGAKEKAPAAGELRIGDQLSDTLLEDFSAWGLRATGGNMRETTITTYIHKLRDITERNVFPAIPTGTPLSAPLVFDLIKQSPQNSRGNFFSSALRKWLLFEAATKLQQMDDAARVVQPCAGVEKGNAVTNTEQNVTDMDVEQQEATPAAPAIVDVACLRQDSYSTLQPELGIVNEEGRSVRPRRKAFATAASTTMNENAIYDSAMEAAKADRQRQEERHHMVTKNPEIDRMAKASLPIDPPAETPRRMSMRRGRAWHRPGKVRLKWLGMQQSLAEATAAPTTMQQHREGSELSIAEEDRRVQIDQLTTLLNTMRNGSTASKQDVEQIYGQIELAAINCALQSQCKSQLGYFVPMSQKELLKEAKTQKELLVGRRVAIFWSGEKRWFSAVIKRTDLTGKMANGPAIEVQYDADDEVALEPLDASTLLLGPRQVYASPLPRRYVSRQSPRQSTQQSQRSAREKAHEDMAAASAQLPLLQAVPSCIPAADGQRIGVKSSPLLDNIGRATPPARLSRVALRLLEEAMEEHDKDFTAVCAKVNSNDSWDQEPLRIDTLTLWSLQQSTMSLRRCMQLLTVIVPFM